MADPIDKKKREEITPNDIWRIYLTEGHSGMMRQAPLRMRPMMMIESGLLKIIPSNPRCVSCYAPFRGVGAPLMRALGKDRSRSHPSICSDCESFVKQNNAGVEVEASLLFADIRGSTTLAEKTTPVEFGKLINRFFSAASDKLTVQGGFIDKLIGDEVSGYFVPGMAGAEHPKKALRAAIDILKVTGHADPDGPWVPVGVGIHLGPTFIGAVGSKEGLSEVTMLGDTANTTARLASAAKPGEILVSSAIAPRAGLDTTGLEKRSLELKGKSESVDVWVVRVGPDTR
jgi:adenylate cyclase